MIAIEGYSEIARIGQGGLGDVYRAVRDSTGGTVAVKVLRDVSDESVAWHRTRRELTALVSLAGHGNVIQLIELLELPEGPALVMEYASGGSVADMMARRDEPLSVGEVVFVGRHTAGALVAAHAQGIVHRDVKPQNLLIDAYGQVKLCDFGIAAMARTDEFRTRTNAISMRYASPEDLDDEVDVGPPSDVYSLGATLLHLARGAPPTLKERLAPWQPPATDDPELAALDEIVAACLHPTPAARPTAATVVDELERLGWSLDERNRALRGDDAPRSALGDESPTGRTAAPPAAADESPSVRSAPAATSTADDAGDAGPGSGPAVSHDGRSPTTPSDDSNAAVTTIDAAAGTGVGRHAGAVDQTVVRPGRRPPARPAAVLPRPRRRRGLIAAVVLGLAAVVAVVATSWWTTDDDPAAAPDEPAVRVVERPAGLVEITTVAWPTGPAGECLVQVDGATELVVVGCDEPHDLQRVAIGELDADTFPADADFAESTVRDVVRDECHAVFRVIVGTPPDESELDAPFSAPSATTWPSGDRGFQCFVGRPGARLVGDVNASDR